MNELAGSRIPDRCVTACDARRLELECPELQVEIGEFEKFSLCMYPSTSVNQWDLACIDQRSESQV